MARLDPRRLQAALQHLHERVLREPHLPAEVQRARREFFGPRLAAGAPLPTAEQRFQEWFLLERESETLGAVPHEAVAADDDSLLDDSLASAFLLAGASGKRLEARDLQDGDCYELHAPAGTLQPGDLMVGRIHPDPAGGWLPSAAVAVYRPGQVVAAALQKDLGQLQLDRRLSQLELEHLLLRSGQHAAAVAPPLERLEAALDTLLRGAGSSRSAAEVSEALAAAARPGPVLGPLLDELAFDTAIDLDRGRELLLELWNAHHAGDAPPPAAGQAPAAEATAAGDGPPGETLGERLVRTLDQGLAQKQDVEELFAQLEAMAGIDPDAEDGEEEDDDPVHGAAAAAANAVDVGDLQPLVQEYLWETGRSDGEPARLLAQWVELQQNGAAPHVDLESVSSTDLLRFLLHVYLGAEPAARAAAVRAAHAALREFLAWAEVAQEMAVRGTLDGCQGALLDQLDRLQAAGLALSASLRAERRPGTGLWRVDDVGAAGFGVRGDDGGEHWIPVAPATAALLRPGDLLLGAVARSDGRAEGGARFAGLVVALPADAEALIG
jgi:hypothetical protein